MNYLIRNEVINQMEYYYVNVSKASSKASSPVFSYFISVFTSVCPVSFIIVVTGHPFEAVL